MVVRTQCAVRGVIKLYIGAKNARRYFPRRVSTVELLLGHLHILCGLTPDFWNDRPEIYDPRLSDWLEHRFYHHSLCREPVRLAMYPVGNNSFRLHPLALPPVSLSGSSRG